MRLFLPIFALCAGFVFAGQFITAREYGEALYRSYDSLSCAACHGKRGEGSRIAAYERKNVEIAIDAPNIKRYGADDLRRGIARHRLAPQYILSDGEISAIAEYLKD